MKKKNKLLAAVIASLLILPSCKTPGQTTDETNETGKAPVTSVPPGTSSGSETEPSVTGVFKGYSVIVRDGAPKNVSEAAEAFLDALGKTTGDLPEIKNDWEGGPVKRSDSEIVIGSSTRNDEFGEAISALADGGFVIARSGRKLLCMGKTDEDTVNGVKYLITVYLNPANPRVMPVSENGELFGLESGMHFTGNIYSRFGVDMKNVDSYVEANTVINVAECGVDNTGNVDMTELMQYLHSSGKKIYYPDGIYLFNGRSLDFSGGVEFQSRNGVVIRNSISAVPIVNFDDSGNLIGLMQNHLELKSGGLDSKNGSLVPPPLFTAQYETTVDFLPIFYNDFGCQRTLTGNYGWTGWFYWTWNHHDTENTVGNDPYDPSRHPLLGYYYGDDPTVLDWQCYWMREYGVDQMIVLANPDTESWDDPYDANHWVYQLFNNTKNFSGMEYVLETPYSGGKEHMETWWKNVINIYAEYPHYYTVTIDGKHCAVLYNWQEDSACGTMGGSDGYAALLETIAEYAKTKLGVDGIAVMSRASVAFAAAQNESLVSHGVYHYAAGYEPNCVDTSKKLRHYDDYVNSFNGDLASDNTVIAISTGMYSHTPHPSGWSITGNTPELFAEWAEKAVKYLEKNDRLIPCVTIYNVAEWAEGGPGFQPNVKDGFGYLEAVAKALGINRTGG